MSSAICQFVAYGVPQPKGSTRAFVRKGRAIVTSDNPKLKDWQHAIAASAQGYAARGMFAGPVAVTAVFYLPHPKTGKRRTAHVVKPDLDKLARALGDALAGLLYADDAMVTDWQVSKRYAEPGTAPRVLVVVSDAEQGPSSWRTVPTQEPGKDTAA